MTAGRLLDGLAFVVTAEDNKLHTLNTTGTALWALAEEGVTVESGTEQLVTEFEVDSETARHDVELCLADYLARGILIQE